MSSVQDSGFFRRLVQEARSRLSSFLLVGLLNTVIGYGLFALIFFLAGPFIGFVGAILVTHVLATSIGYFNLSKLTFSDSTSRFAWLKYQSFYAIPLITNLIVVPILIEFWAMNTYLAQGLFTIFYGVFAYLFHLVVTFQTTKRTPSSE
jgi:putative flippase GtrA